MKVGKHGPDLGKVVGPRGKSNLPGRFDFELEWTAEDVRGLSVDAGPLGNNDRPSLFTALQEKLGLKVESARGAVPFLVIDAAERPEPD